MQRYCSTAIIHVHRVLWANTVQCFYQATALVSYAERASGDLLTHWFRIGSIEQATNYTYLSSNVNENNLIFVKKEGIFILSECCCNDYRNFNSQLNNFQALLHNLV